jgi:hypothetical protein
MHSFDEIVEVRKLQHQEWREQAQRERLAHAARPGNRSRYAPAIHAFFAWIRDHRVQLTVRLSVEPRHADCTCCPQ